MNIEYDKSPNITPEQQLKSLADSTRRAFNEMELMMEELKAEVERLRELAEK